MKENKFDDFISRMMESKQENKEGNSITDLTPYLNRIIGGDDDQLPCPGRMPCPGKNLPCNPLAG